MNGSMAALLLLPAACEPGTAGLSHGAALTHHTLQANPAAEHICFALL